MSRLSKLLGKWKPQFNINLTLPFGGRRKKEEPKKEITMGETKPWYRSKAKLGVLAFTLVNIIEHTLPAFGINIPIPAGIHTFLDYIFGGLAAWGVRDAIKS